MTMQLHHIHVLAPSACVRQQAILQAKQALENLNINISLSKNIFEQYRYLAGTPQQRLADLQYASQDASIQAIWCGRGGTGAAQLLPDLDMKLFQVPLIGYSDSTTLLNYIAMHGGSAIHGAVFEEIAEKNISPQSDTSPTISHDAAQILQLLQQPQQAQTYTITQVAPPYSSSDKILSGKILGGNLTTLASLQGTPWALTITQPTILMLEDVGEPYYRLERCFLQLLQSIDTSQLQAVILGDFYQCPQKNVPHSIHQIFAEYLSKLQIPLYQCHWFGHGEQNRPFWLGKTGYIQRQILTI